MDPAYAGRGIATAITTSLLDLAFGEHGLRDSFHAELGWIDGYTYAMLAEEWTLTR